MTERDIMHEAAGFWVGRERNAYVVYRVSVTHSVSDSAYAKTADGLSIAIARCNYLADRPTRHADKPRYNP
jgi:hypothetical protein